MLPKIAADVVVVTLVCVYMLMHHMMFEPYPQHLNLIRLLLPDDIFVGLHYDSSEQTDDGEEWEWGSQDTTVCGDETGHGQTAHDGETEPLLHEWIAEQRLLSNNIRQIDVDDGDDENESTFSTSSTENNEFIPWLGVGDSGYSSS